MQPISTSLVPPRPVLAREDAIESLMVHMAERAVLLLTGNSVDAVGLRRALADAGLMVIKVGTTDEAELVSCLPRFALVDVALPGALALLQRLTSEAEGVLAIAILPPDGSASEAVQAGACATLHAPLSPADVVTIFERLRGIRERHARSVEVSSRREASTSAILAARVASGIVEGIAEPLGAARRWLDALSAELELSPSVEARSSLRRVEDALRDVEHLASRVRGLGASRHLPLGRVALLDVTREAIEPLRRGARATLSIDGAPHVAAIASERALVEVVRALVESALESVKTVADPWILVRVYETVGEARISVRDNGPSIPMSARTHVFEPFFTAAGRARPGLSLSVAYWAVVNMDGVLAISREPGQGACFRIRLPRA
jgi:signal transduction histidine kinase